MADVVLPEAMRSPDSNEVVMEKSVICYESCQKLKLELQETLSEFSSALTITKLLQENENRVCLVSEWTNGQNLNQDGILAQNERKEGTWILANSSRHKKLREPNTRYCAPIPSIVNRCEVLYCYCYCIVCSTVRNVHKCQYRLIITEQLTSTDQ